ncbi:MAG: hypothetical protein ACT4OE_03640 [Sphingosinicella sp.]
MRRAAVRAATLAAILAAAPLAGQEPQVERLTLRPGESASFTLARGFDHQLLVRAAPGAPGAITVSYEVAGGMSTITATSRTGFALTFSVLADPDGNGGYSQMGEIALPGDGTAAVRRWPGSLGPINVGSFEGGPHGEHGHESPGDRR